MTNVKANYDIAKMMNEI